MADMTICAESGGLRERGRDDFTLVGADYYHSDGQE